MTAAVLTGISPTTGETGTAVTLTATGTGFVDGDVIAYGIEDLDTIFVDATSLTAEVTPIDPGPHDVLVRCGDGDTDALSFEATTAEYSGEECLEALKTGDISKLAGTPADELDWVRTEFKAWADVEGARIEKMYDETYAAILAEMARKGVPY